MRNRFFLLMTISVFGMSFAGCSASFSTGTNTAAANAAKPTNATTTANANKPANSAPSAANSDKPKPALANEKKPEGTAKTASKENPVPADWIYIYDENKGYGFSVPAGTTGETEKAEGVDFFGATTPSGVDMFVLSYRDKEMTKEDLLKFSVAFLEGLGQKVTPGALKAESDDYAVADATTAMPDGSKGKLRIMVGTDVSDNYVMILGADNDKFAANEKIIDEIWGSFEMWSGGASNN